MEHFLSPADANFFLDVLPLWKNEWPSSSSSSSRFPPTYFCHNKVLEEWLATPLKRSTTSRPSPRPPHLALYRNSSQWEFLHLVSRSINSSTLQRTSFLRICPHSSHRLQEIRCLTRLTQSGVSLSRQRTFISMTRVPPAGRERLQGCPCSIS